MHVFDASHRRRSRSEGASHTIAPGCSRLKRRLVDAGFEIEDEDIGSARQPEHSRYLRDGLTHDVDCAAEHDDWEVCSLHCSFEARREIVQDSISGEAPNTLLSEWLLLENWGGQNSQPPSPNPSLAGSGTVTSRWLTDGSSTELSSIVSESAPAEASPTNFVVKIATWAHPPCDEANVNTPEFLALHTKFKDIQKALTTCEQQLVELEGDKAPTLPACSKLCGELVTLAADALECGCSREVPGAMDAFEQANAAVERVAKLLTRDGDTPLRDEKMSKNVFLDCLLGVVVMFQGCLDKSS